MEWEFIENAEPQTSDDFWYDLTSGGYIHLDKLIKNKEQLEAANKAIDLLTSLKDALENAELIETI